MELNFSKLNKSEKISWIADNLKIDREELSTLLSSFCHNDTECQKLLDGFSENTLSNYPMPYGVAPHFKINGEDYIIPMVIEESSVVAAASSAAKFWKSRGGIKTAVISTIKVGQLHFVWNGSFNTLKEKFDDLIEQYKTAVTHLVENMEARGGGFVNFELLEFPEEKNYYQIRVAFETCDSMGANFINTLLEELGVFLKTYIAGQTDIREEHKDIEIIMAILSNYTPDCIVRAEVECAVTELEEVNGLSAEIFAYKFAKAVRIAEIDPYRATTHNKGIYNGVDAVVLATGNDFRAIEACGHTHASRDGQYRSLSHCSIENGRFRFWLDLPLAVGTVGGLTKLHPLARLSLTLLRNPTAPELMQIIAAVGLAQNFAAIRSLVTTGIQKGHMKMHLLNILHQLQATEEEIALAQEHFNDKVISYALIRKFLEETKLKQSH